MPKNKIPCSVGIITLNNGKTLSRTLKSIRNFSEIIICDGNSTDDTLKIAKKFNCKVIPQYQTKQPNVAIKDKSAIRNKTIKAASHDWYMYIDSDDEVTPELVRHVQQITNSKNPHIRIWKADCRIKVGKKVIQHSASYPDKRVLLVHKSTHAYWDKPEHEVIRYDKARYKSGILRGHMYLCWSEKRIGSEYWRNAQKWLERDFNFHKTKSWHDYWNNQIVYNILAAGGFAFRALKQYIRFGFKNSMPPRVELYRILYQLKLMAKFTQYFFFSKNS